MMKVDRYSPKTVFIIPGKQYNETKVKMCKGKKKVGKLRFVSVSGVKSAQSLKSLLKDYVYWIFCLVSTLFQRGRKVNLSLYAGAYLDILGRDGN